MGPETAAAAQAAGAKAPALADALVLAAEAWQRFEAGQSLDRALQAALRPARDLSPSLAGAARDLATTAVRHRAVVEFLLGALVHRAPDPPVRALIAVALAQLLARAYTEFTLVDQAVHAARSWPQAAQAGAFVNAVLRAFLRRRRELEARALADAARRFNVPPWWLARLRSEYGARADAVLAAQLEEPPLVLRVNARRASVAGVLQRLAAAGLDAVQAGPSAVWLRRPMPVERIPGFAEGLVSVQDAGAQLAAPWLDVAAGMRVLDACAAPGGKTAHLLETVDCRVDAVELDPERAARIDANLSRLGLASSAGGSVRVQVADILQPADYWDGHPYDRILLDAPCTASGIVRRHPDVVWLRRPADVANLATRQAKMLRTLWPMLAPAGRLLYVVCSVFAEEGRQQISAFLRRQAGARSVPLLVEDAAGSQDGVQLLPGSVAEASARAGAYGKAMPLIHDGFFYALLEKT